MAGAESSTPSPPRLGLVSFPFSIMKQFVVLENTKKKARIEKKMNALDDNVEVFLPLEIMFEILSRLAVASLLRCKRVCKRWNEIIHHPKFIQMHMLRRKNQFVSYSTSKDDETFIVIVTRYGLLLEKSKISGKYRVRNPATKQVLALPDPKDLKEEPLSMMIVFLESSCSYKLVYIYKIEGQTGNVGFKVLSFEGSDLSWRSVDKSYFSEFGRMDPRISVDSHGRFLYCGVLYSYEGGRSCDYEIHCLDVETESLRSIPINVPRKFFCNLNGKKIKLGRWDQKLVAVMSLAENELHVWVLEDPIQGKWAEEKMIIPLTFVGMTETLRPYSASHEEIRFTKNEGHFICYRIRSKKAWELNYSTLGNTVMCNGTLVTLKGMQPEKNHSSDDVLDEISPKFVKLVN